MHDQDTLSAVCTASCKTALDTYLNEVKSACQTSRYDGADGLSYHAGYGTELVWESFNILCTVNS